MDNLFTDRLPLSLKFARWIPWFSAVLPKHCSSSQLQSTSCHLLTSPTIFHHVGCLHLWVTHVPANCRCTLEAPWLIPMLYRLLQYKIKLSLSNKLVFKKFVFLLNLTLTAILSKAPINYLTSGDLARIPINPLGVIWWFACWSVVD